MSFGFSVGDFVAVGKLIADIITCLQESGGAKTDYQELMRELTALDHALRSLDRMKPSNTSSTALDSIKFSALSCRHLLETFLRKIQKYDRTLGVWAKPGLGKSAVDKVRWNFDGRNEIQALQNYLNQHVNTIHILLAEHGLERLDMAEQRILDDNLRTQERLDKTNEIVLAIKDDMLAQVSAVKTVQYMLSELYRVVCGEMRVSWNTLGQLVANTCVSTQQIYTIVLEIRNHVTSVDTRWSFFQEPVVIEDAFGFKFPVPSEYDFDMLQTIIQLRFKDVPGSSEVRLGNYELCETRCRDKRLNKNARIHPGAEITMAMIVGVASPEVQACPVPSCGSSRVVLHAKGGMICNDCRVWSVRANKNRISIGDIYERFDSQDQNAEVGIPTLPTSASQLHLENANKDDHEPPLRNITWAVDDTKQSSRKWVVQQENTKNFSEAKNSSDELKAAIEERPRAYEDFLASARGYRAGSRDLRSVFENLLLLSGDSSSILPMLAYYLQHYFSLEHSESLLKSHFPKNEPPGTVETWIWPRSKRIRYVPEGDSNYFRSISIYSV